MERRQASYHQPDLFVVEKPPSPMPLERRARLVPLIGALLAEATTAPVATETDNEDHG